MHIVQGSNKKNTATKYMCFFWFSQIWWFCLRSWLNTSSQQEKQELPCLVYLQYHSFKIKSSKQPKKPARLTHAGVISYVKQKHPGLTPLIFFGQFLHTILGQTLVQSLSPFFNRVTKKISGSSPSCLHFPLVLRTTFRNLSSGDPSNLCVQLGVQLQTWAARKQQKRETRNGGVDFWLNSERLVATKKQQNCSFFFFWGGGWARSQNSNNYCRCFFYNKKRFAQVQSYHYICLKHL